MSNIVSLITLFREVRVDAAANVIGPTSVVPNKWHVITVWYCETPDPDTKYEQRISLITSSGEAILDIPTIPLDMSRSEFRHVTAIDYFPVGRAGDLRLVLFLREVGADQWREITYYPMGVRYGAGAP